jgi:hypothetical protein
MGWGERALGARARSRFFPFDVALGQKDSPKERQERLKKQIPRGIDRQKSKSPGLKPSCGGGFSGG